MEPGPYPPDTSVAPRCALLGLGRAGRALRAEFEASGVPVVGAWNRTARPDLQDPRGHSPIYLRERPPAPLLAADVLVLAVSDDAIEALLGDLRRWGLPDGRVLLHLSGSRESADISGCPAGCVLGGWHPLQSFARVSGAGVPPYVVAMDGPDAARARGRELARATGHPVLDLPPGSKARYHAAAVLASNALVALEAVATRVLAEAGLPVAEAWGALRPLFLGTAANLGELGDGDFSQAITGPAARGDAGTVARNLAALADDPGAAAVYRVLGREAANLAESGGLPEQLAVAVRAALDEDPARP